MSSNPFSPGFGTPPPLLAGRDDHLAAAVEALRAGPRHPLFRHAYHGVRGVGKTVLLDAIAGAARDELGWPVVSHQAIRDESLLAAVLAKLPPALDAVSWRGTRLLQGLDKQVKVGVHLIVRAEASVGSPRRALPPAASAVIERVVLQVGEAAASRHRGVLVVVDEVQATRRQPDLEAFARVMQVVSRRVLPVAVVLAGLPDTPDHLARAGTFTERLPSIRLGHLSPEATRYALVKPAADGGVRFADDALAELAARTGGYPYFVQLLGFHVWEAARGGSVVTLPHVHRGVEGARRHVVASMYEPRWRRLNRLEQAYVAAAAAEGETASTGKIAAAVGRTHQQLSPVRASLIAAHHLLEPAGRGVVRFAIPGFAAWVRSGPEG